MIFFDVEVFLGLSVASVGQQHIMENDLRRVMSLFL